MLKAKVYRVNEDAILPEKYSEEAAGYDVAVCLQNEFALLPPHTSKTFTTGLVIEPPEGYFIALYSRSGIAKKRGLRLGNCVGVCDNDYRGELKVIIHNDTDTTQKVVNHERVAQIVFLPYQHCDFEEVSSASELSNTERGESGFGSTGENGVSEGGAT